MQHAPAVAVTQRVEDLLKDCLCTLLIKPLTLFDILKQIASTRVLHDHKEVLLAFEDFKKANHARVANLLQNVDFLENFAARVLILDVHFVYAFNCNILAGQFVNTQRDLAKGTLPQQFDEAIEVKGRVRDLSMLLHVSFDVADELVSILCHRIIQNHLLVLGRSVHG